MDLSHLDIVELIEKFEAVAGERRTINREQFAYLLSEMGLPAADQVGFCFRGSGCVVCVVCLFSWGHGVWCGVWVCGVCVWCVGGKKQTRGHWHGVQGTRKGAHFWCPAVNPSLPPLVAAGNGQQVI